MGTKTGELRETLIDCIDKVLNGQMDPNKAKAVAALAGQINLSLQVEIAACETMMKWEIGKAPESIGELALGDERPVKLLPGARAA